MELCRRRWEARNLIRRDSLHDRKACHVTTLQAIRCIERLKLQRRRARLAFCCLAGLRLDLGIRGGPGRDFHLNVTAHKNANKVVLSPGRQSWKRSISRGSEAERGKGRQEKPSHGE